MKFHNVSYRYNRSSFAADIELTNKCNLQCTFCPRENTPRTGFMSRDTFYKVIARIKESPIPFLATSCGTGDSILHPELADFVAHSRSNDIPYRLTTSATLLNRKKAAELIDAGLNEIHFSVTGIHEQYTSTYGFPFEKTLENIHTFNELSGNGSTCDIKILIIQTEQVLKDLDNILTFWHNQGFARNRIHLLEEHNRSGSHIISTASGNSSTIATDSHYTAEMHHAACPVPYFTVFIGWDGKYYLCSNDWEKKARFGDIHQYSFIDIYQHKMAYTQQDTAICNACSYKPINYLTDISSTITHPPRQALETFIANTRHTQQLIAKTTAEMISYATTGKTTEPKATAAD